MPKFLFMGDRHNAETIPSSRIDNYHENTELKDLEIIQIAKENNVDAIIHPGDFWTDSDKKLGLDFLAKIALRWRNSGIPIIGIAGNHDLIGNNINSLDSTSTGFLNALGIFKIISPGEVLMFNDDVSVAITGTNYHKGMDKPENIDDYIVKEKKADYHIHLVHGMLTTKSFGTLFRHTTIDQIVSTNADITLCGHDHIGFGIVNYKNKYFINPGAVVRMTCAENEINRTVSVVLIDITKDGISCKLIPLKSAKPSEEVLSRTEVEEEKRRETYKNYIKDGVEKLKLGNGVTIIDVLDDIYQRDEIPEEIREDINTKLTSKLKTVTGNKKVAPTGTKIKTLEIKNFQSHADTKIDLDDFNVIVGESHQGKSALLRGLRWLAENKPAGKGIIRFQETEAYVNATLENGTIVQRYITPKENGYRIYYPDGTVSTGNTKMVETVQDVLGWCNMKIGENEELPLNHLKQGDSWYLIGDKYTASDRARILGAINNTDGADILIKELEKDNSKINEAIKYETTDIAVLSGEIEVAEKEKQDLLKQKELIQKAILIEKIKEYISVKNEYQDAVAAFNEIDSRFNEINLREYIKNVKEKIAKFDNIKDRLSTIETETKRIQTIDPMIQTMENSINTVVPMVSKIKNNITIFNTISEINDNIIKYQKTHAEMVELEEKLTMGNINTTVIKDNIRIYEQIQIQTAAIKKANWAMNAAEQFINASEFVKTYNNDKKSLIDKIDKFIKIKETLYLINTNAASLNIATSAFDKADEEYNKAIEAKTNILSETHICPVCYSNINDEMLEEIIKKSK